MTETISTTQMLHALESMCDTIENEKEYHLKLDSAIGGGDHGVKMAKCFREVKNKLAESSAEDVGTLFKDVGMESTKDMLAKMGRASRLGERTIGHQDAGATSCYFILRSFSDEFPIVHKKGLPQDFPDCGLHNGKYTKNQPIENCGHIVP